MGVGYGLKMKAGRAPNGLHVKDVCRALGTGDQPRHTENMRTKLKRLVGRDILTEPQPGLFAIETTRS
jgi:hypothetical protein